MKMQATYLQLLRGNIRETTQAGVKLAQRLHLEKANDGPQAPNTFRITLTDFPSASHNTHLLNPPK